MRSPLRSGNVDVLTRGDTFVARVYRPGAPLDAVHVEISSASRFLFPSVGV